MKHRSERHQAVLTLVLVSWANYLTTAGESLMFGPFKMMISTPPARRLRRDSATGPTTLEILSGSRTTGL